MTSYSTLMRQAKAAKTATAKAALLKKANAIRRKTRKAKQPKIVAVDDLSDESLTKAINMAYDSVTGWQAIDRGAPGQGEIVNGDPTEPYHFRVATETFENLKKQKKIDGNAEIALRSLVMTGVSEGRRMEREAHSRSIIETNREWRNNIVRAFISECNVIMQMNKGLPGAMVVSGLSIARVLDALAEAGWSETNRKAKQPKITDESEAGWSETNTPPISK